MPKVKSRNVYADTTFYLITIKNGKLNTQEFYKIGQKGQGIEFITATKGISDEDYVLVGTHLDTEYDISPVIVTDIEEQRKKVFEHLKERYSTFKPESVDL